MSIFSSISLASTSLSSNSPLPSEIKSEGYRKLVVLVVEDEVQESESKTRKKSEKEKK
jgi:hypothetical protein